MSIEDKLGNAKETHWLTDGIPKWEVWIIVFTTKLRLKIGKLIHRHNSNKDLKEEF